MDLPLPFHPPLGPPTPDRDRVHSELIARTTDGCFVTDARGCFVAADDTLARLLGHNLRDLIGRHTTDFVHSRSRGPLRRQIERASPAVIDATTASNSCTGTAASSPP
ncbi:MAG: PAS domain-containing protein [Zoogloea sp.]|nr:PAS domain-containing protein [Zoogloea sp.]